MTVEEWKRKNPPIQRKPITNADRIRQMSDEELAEMFWIRVDCELCPNKEQYCSDDCKGHWLAWLKEQAEEAE